MVKYQDSFYRTAMQVECGNTLCRTKMHVWTMIYLVGDGSEGILNLLAALHVLCLLGDHEGHVLLQGYEAIPKWKDN